MSRAMDSSVQAEAPGKGLRAMVVEDDTVMRSLIAQMLRDMEFEEVLHFNGVEEASRALQANPVNILISDWVMPDISGLEFLKEIRNSADPLISETRFLMLTGHSDKDKVLEAVEAGVDGFLAKPISPAIFYDRVVTVLQKRRPAPSENVG